MALGPNVEHSVITAEPSAVGTYRNLSESIEVTTPQANKQSQFYIDKLFAANQQELQTENNKNKILATAGDFLSNKLASYTAWSSAALNFVSAFARLLPNDSKMKQWINNISERSTQAHQIVYGSGGIVTGLVKKNLFHLASFISEVLVGFVKLKPFYLVKAFASMLDILPTCVEDICPSKHKTYKQSLANTSQAIKTKLTEVRDNPSILLKKSSFDTHVPILGSIFGSIGSIIGLTFSDLVGGVMRGFGAIGIDFALLFNKLRTANISGLWYNTGSVGDLFARVIRGLGHMLGLTKETADKIADMLHEAAITCDKVGQRFFIKFLHETTKEDNHSSLPTSSQIQMSMNSANDYEVNQEKTLAAA